MKCVIQRVLEARLEVDGVVHAELTSPGLVALVGFERGDPPGVVPWCADRLVHLRIFPDDAGKMNRSVIDVGGGLLLVPNFTLAGEASRGRRPSFDRATAPDLARSLFESLVSHVSNSVPNTQSGVFRTHMRVSLVNDGPVTLLLDSRDMPGASATGLAETSV